MHFPLRKICILLVKDETILLGEKYLDKIPTSHQPQQWNISILSSGKIWQYLKHKLFY